jgi:pimeloyl-ACP methyl ester carboxylesterase
VPVILTLHGWSGSREKSLTNDDGSPNGAVVPFLDRGYGVVAIDARGHGDSGGRALVHHPDREVNDFRSVLDWIHDEVDWAQKDGSGRSKDVRAGAYGASYGGGFQLQTAAWDRRLDALVPVVTWNDLPRSLAPNGAIKTDWVALLYGAAKLSVDLDPRIDEWFLEGAATNRFPRDATASFLESSPASRLHEIEEPTLLIQGLPDTLFPLNEAVANFAGIRRNLLDRDDDEDDEDRDPPVWLVGINTGHVFPGLQPTGVNAPDRSREIHCLDLPAMVATFYDAYLKRDPAAREAIEAIDRVTLATEQDSAEAPDCVTSRDWPPSPATVDVSFPALPVPQTGGSYVVPLLTASEETVVAGIPRFTSGPVVELDEIFYLSLVLRDADGIHVVDDQVQGVRAQLASLEGTLNVDLGGVATRLQPGDALDLRIDALNEQYAGNGSRVPKPTVLTNVVVSIPVVD